MPTIHVVALLNTVAKEGRTKKIKKKKNYKKFKIQIFALIYASI